MLKKSLLYQEADGFNEELLERFIITNSSGIMRVAMMMMVMGMMASDADSTSFGSRSESSTNSSDEGRNDTIQK